MSWKHDMRFKLPIHHELSRSPWQDDLETLTYSLVVRMMLSEFLRSFESLLDVGINQGWHCNFINQSWGGTSNYLKVIVSIPCRNGLRMTPQFCKPKNALWTIQVVFSYIVCRNKSRMTRDSVSQSWKETWDYTCSCYGECF